MIRIDDPARLGPAIEDLRTMLGVSRRSLARAVGNATHRDTDSINSQLWAWERGHRSPHPESLAAVLAELGYALAFVPLIEAGPEGAPASTLSDQEADTHTRVGSDGINGSAGKSEGDGGWNWTPTTDGGFYSGPHGPDICPAMGCRHEGGAA